MAAVSNDDSATRRPRWSPVTRFASIILLAFLIGTILNEISRRMEEARPIAGFARGVLQGALMPAAMPNLLVGRDVMIYSVNNNGLFYKLGYTMGVNACGAAFFGMFYWRFKKWRNRGHD